MGIGEIVLIIIVALIILFLFFIYSNNLKFKKKQEKIKKEAKAKDVQPIADVSPQPIEKISNKGKEVPLNVNDPIFSKKMGYENITERVDVGELISQEKEQENIDIVNKLDKIQITSEPIDSQKFDEIDELAKPTKTADFADVEKEINSVALNKKDEQNKQSNDEILKTFDDSKEQDFIVEKNISQPNGDENKSNTFEMIKKMLDEENKKN